MNLSHKRKFKIKPLAAAFLLPFGWMLFVMLISGYEPFGDHSMLYSDMYHQYYPFFVAFRRALRSGDSLLYSWNVGLGMDYLGLIAYYLASPLNLLSVLVPEEWLLEFFSLLMPVKLGLAGLFFAIFLKKLFRKDDLSIAIFGGFYGLCAWALGFQWNIMWLDSFALLPLVALGTVSLLRDKKFILYTLTLFQAIFSNYYIGFFVCIFVFLLFFVYQICRWRGWKRFFFDLCRIAFFSVLAIGMTAILELPAFAALQTTQSSVNKFPDSFRLNIASSHDIPGLLDAMRQVVGNMGGAIKPNFKEGLPNVYCGVGTILLAVLFLLSDDVKRRDKICAVCLLLFFNVSFIIRQLDYIWHGFHFTNMIPYRFSFLYCFVMLYMAYRGWLVRRRYEPWRILVAGILTAAVLCCSNELLEMQEVELLGREMELPVYIIYNGSFLLLYVVVMIYGSIRRKVAEDAEPEVFRQALRADALRRASATTLMLGFIGVELMATVCAFGIYFPGTNVENYPRGTEAAASMIRYMHEREEDTLFYRAETTHSQTLNDGALNNYNGVSTFTSSANVKVTEFMKALGYGAKNTYNRYCFEESSPVANLFLDLKYMIERDGRDRSSTYFTDLHHFKEVHLLKNNAYLPLGFLAEPELAAVDFSASNGSFSFQNELFRAATGLEGDVWYRMQGDNTSIVGTGVTITESSSSGYCDYGEAEKGSTITYSYIADRDGFCCIHLDLPKRNDYHVILNGENLYKETISLPQMIAVGDMEAGDILDIRIACDKGEDSTMTVTAALMDHDLFRQGYEILSAATMELLTFENTYVEGIINCNRDGLLYASIPQNGNWSITVDAEPAEITLVGDVMIGVELKEGSHTVAFRYRNDAFSLGWKISLGCLAVFLILVMAVYRPDWKNRGRKPHTGKYAK
ncbi:MAG: YfhO family protein [Oscillospiraceae bacterium]|nr:YfhO family protein [Oscillospiraceae bacterium]MBQ7130342.1 YfhO family protein [Oscillospiraceae bacterium]